MSGDAIDGGFPDFQSQPRKGDSSHSFTLQETDVRVIAKTYRYHNGLRKQIEKNIPAFYPLRSGYTTGACATAAAKAALTALILGEEQKMISFRLPDDEEMTLPVAHTEIEKNSATCTVVKDAGDDPDVTHGASIVVTIMKCLGRGGRFIAKTGIFAACAAFTFSENPPDSPLSLVRMACGCSVSNKRVSDSPA